MCMMYIKDFSWWCKDKEYIHNSTWEAKYPKVREVWYVKRGVNVWFEVDGKNCYLRPVIVLRKIGSLYFCVPLTTKHKENKYHYLLDYKTFNKTSSVMLSQARIIDIKRFSDNIWWVYKEDFYEIKKIMKEMYLS